MEPGAARAQVAAELALGEATAGTLLQFELVLALARLGVLPWADATAGVAVAQATVKKLIAVFPDVAVGRAMQRLTDLQNLIDMHLPQPEPGARPN